MMLEKKLFFFLNFCSGFEKDPLQMLFCFLYYKELFGVTMRNSRGDGACVVLLVPLVLPPEDLAERYFSIQHREKDHFMCLLESALHTPNGKGIRLLSWSRCQILKWPRSSRSTLNVLTMLFLITVTLKLQAKNTLAMKWWREQSSSST